MLFYFAGYEIDFERIEGKPLRLGAIGWGLSIALAYGIGGILAAAGIVVSFLYTGSAMATTAIGTLIPILRDRGELKTRFGTYLLGAGACGEFGPVLLITLVLSTSEPLHKAVILLGFIVLALAVALSSVRLVWKGWPALERTFEASSQLAVRITVVLVFGLVRSPQLGLDVLLALRAGVARAAFKDHELTLFIEADSGWIRILRPLLFVTSGLQFDLNALGSSTALLKRVVSVPLRGRARHPGPAAVSGRPQHQRARRLGLLLRHRAAAGGRDHDPCDPRRPHAPLDRRRTGRRGDALDPDLPLRRPRLKKRADLGDGERPGGGEEAAALA